MLLLLTKVGNRESGSVGKVGAGPTRSNFGLVNTGAMVKWVEGEDEDAAALLVLLAVSTLLW